MFKTINNLYANAKSYFQMGNAKSESFVSNVVVRQGENLSQIAISIFLNDLSDRIYAHSCFSSLVQSLLSKDTLSRTYLTSLQLVTGTVWRR